MYVVFGGSIQIYSEYIYSGEFKYDTILPYLNRSHNLRQPIDSQLGGISAVAAFMQMCAAIYYLQKIYGDNPKGEKHEKQLCKKIPFVLS